MPDVAGREPIDPVVRLVWALANAEACRTNDPAIRPAHFLVAILQVLDDAFPRDPTSLGVTDTDLEDLPAAVAAVRASGLIDADQVTTARRALRAHRPASGAGTIKRLHRSAESRSLFERVASEHGGRVGLAELLAGLLGDPPPEADGLFAGGEAPAPMAVLDETPGQTDWGRSDDLDLVSPAMPTPAVDLLARDLSALARDGRLAPVVGRKQEMRTLARYLQRTIKPNTILIGGAGVGKTAVVEGLAQRLSADAAPAQLRRLRIVQVNVADLVAGTTYRGDLEQRLKDLIAELEAAPDLVLFLDEIHLVVNAGSGPESPMDVGNILKPALGREEFRCIGATTTEEFDRFVAPDAAFARRFQVLRIDEPSAEQTLEICRAWARRLEERRDVTILDEAVSAAVGLSSEFLLERAQPDKAIDLLENAVAFVGISSLSFRDSTPTKTPPVITPREITAVLEEQYGVPGS